MIVFLIDGICLADKDLIELLLDLGTRRFLILIVLNGDPRAILIGS